MDFWFLVSFNLCKSRDLFYWKQDCFIWISCEPSENRTSLVLYTFYQQCGALRDELKASAHEGRWVFFLDPYSHIDQSPVEVLLTRDNNGPDPVTRHVSVLLSSRIIDPEGLLSAAWIHSQVCSARHTAVTRHKEGSISTALRFCSYTSMGF